MRVAHRILACSNMRRTRRWSLRAVSGLRARPGEASVRCRRWCLVDPPLEKGGAARRPQQQVPMISGPLVGRLGLLQRDHLGRQFLECRDRFPLSISPPLRNRVFPAGCVTAGRSRALARHGERNLWIRPGPYRADARRPDIVGPTSSSRLATRLDKVPHRQRGDPAWTSSPQIGQPISPSSHIPSHTAAWTVSDKAGPYKTIETANRMKS